MQRRGSAANLLGMMRWNESAGEKVNRIITRCNELHVRVRVLSKSVVGGPAARPLLKWSAPGYFPLTKGTPSLLASTIGTALRLPLTVFAFWALMIKDADL
ncbi:hypothetical protein LX32DRAFT_679220 [Colletotrichum zoysiae]|uniref:Uncharacterized protein n=1 Tax=Colletotrichum zoysiae TaxID=1216348 RepID=A0AAD9HUY6_9PEZI|nr:hypothetical protein LX32DRAFT_679220 [Colletotrichum zoysiae]